MTPWKRLVIAVVHQTLTGTVMTLTKRELILGAVAIGAFCLLITASVLLAIGVTGRNTQKNVPIDNIPRDCLEPGCLEGAGKMAFFMNKTMDPCDNFHMYACGGMEGRIELEPAAMDWTIYYRMFSENEEKLLNALGAPSRRNVDWASEVKVKNFYKSCMDTYGNTVNGSQQFINKILNPSGGWNALGTWDESQYSVTNALKKVHIDFYRDALFKVSVAGDWLDFRKNSIQVNVVLASY